MDAKAIFRQLPGWSLASLRIADHRDGIFNPTLPRRWFRDNETGGDLPVDLFETDSVVAVGTTIAGRPPRRSVRALTSAYGSYLGWWRRSVVLAFRTLASLSDMLAPLCVG